MCSFAHSASTLKCRINRSTPFKYFHRLSRFNRFNRDPGFDYNMPSHSQVVYEGNVSRNNPKPEPLLKKLVEVKGPTAESKKPALSVSLPPSRAHDNLFQYQNRVT